MIRGTDSTDRHIPHPSVLERLKAKKGRVVALAAGLLSLAFAYPSLSRWAQSDRSIDPSRVRLATVERGRLERAVAVEGRVVAAYHPTLFSPAQGIVRLEIQAGEVVAEGQLLAVVKSPELESRLEQQRSLLLAMESELERQRLAAKQLDLENRRQVELLEVRSQAAARALERAQKTFGEGVTGAADYERAQDDLRLASLELMHARGKEALDRERVAFEVRQRELEVNRQHLATDELLRQVTELEVRSPVAGMASRIDVADRDAVAGGQPLLGVVDLSAFEVQIGVPEAYADEVAAGTPVEITSGGARYPGRVRRIAPEVDGAEVEGRAAFTGAMPRGLKQNQRVTVRLVLEARPDVLKVRRGPFLESGGGHEAYVVDDGVARRRRIEVGAVSVAEVEIVAGLSAGDIVVISDTARFRGADNVLVRR